MSLDLSCSTCIATVSFSTESSLGARGKMSPGGAGASATPGAPYIVQPRGHGERYSTNMGELSGASKEHMRGIQTAYTEHLNGIFWDPMSIFHTYGSSAEHPMRARYEQGASQYLAERRCLGSNPMCQVRAGASQYLAEGVSILSST